MLIDGSYVAAGALTGFVVGLTGIGGGALMTPILLFVFGVSPVTAVATDLWFAAVTKLAGARIHHSSGNVDWQVVRRLWAGSVPAALAVVLLVWLGRPLGKLDWLTSAIGVILVMTAAGLLMALPLRGAVTGATVGGRRLDALRPALTVAAGGFIGLCVALTSVGAGALGTVMMMWLYPSRLTPHRLVATDLVHAIPLAIVAGLGYLLAGLVDWAMLGSLLIGSIPAVLAGSVLAMRFNASRLRLALALVLLAAGVKALA